MKKLILLPILILFTSLGFAQEDLYTQGYSTGLSIAQMCDNPNRHQMYSNTINGNFPSAYKAGVREGYNSYTCGTFGDFTGGDGGDNETGNWFCENLGLFCDSETTNDDPGGNDQ